MKELLDAIGTLMGLTAVIALLFLVGAADAPVGVWVGMAVLLLALLPTLPKRDANRKMAGMTTPTEGPAQGPPGSPPNK